MKRPLVAVSIAILMLSGCAAPPAPSPVLTPTNMPTPTATATLSGMSIAEAGQFYLATVCPGNEAADVLNSALKAGELAAITSAAATARDLLEARAQVFGDTTVSWPAEISPEDLKLLKDHSLESAAQFNTVALSQSIAEVSAAVDAWNNAPDKTVREDGQAAAQRIRALLELSGDTQKGC